MTFAGNSVPGRPFRAYLAYLPLGKARHVKMTQKALKNNAVRLELPKLGQRERFILLFLCGHIAHSAKPTARPMTLRHA